jgi:hypothetical protein
VSGALELAGVVHGVVGEPVEGVLLSTREEAEQRADEIREHLSLGFGKLVTARAMRDDLALGYPSWWEYVEGEFGDLQSLGLPATERQIVAASMHLDGRMNQREIADRLAVSPGTINADLKKLDVRPETTVGKDGKEYPAKREVARPAAFRRAEGTTKRDEVVARAAHERERGITCLEIELATGWRHGIASSPFSWVAQQKRIVPTGERRLGYGVYCLPEYLPIEGEVAE